MSIAGVVARLCSIWDGFNTAGLQGSILIILGSRIEPPERAFCQASPGFMRLHCCFNKNVLMYVLTYDSNIATCDSAFLDLSSFRQSNFNKQSFVKTLDFTSVSTIMMDH